MEVSQAQAGGPDARVGTRTGGGCVVWRVWGGGRGRMLEQHGTGGWAAAGCIGRQWRARGCLRAREWRGVQWWWWWRGLAQNKTHQQHKQRRNKTLTRPMNNATQEMRERRSVETRTCFCMHTPATRPSCEGGQKTPKDIQSMCRSGGKCSKGHSAASFIQIPTTQCRQKRPWWPPTQSE